MKFNNVGNFNVIRCGPFSAKEERQIFVHSSSEMINLQEVFDYIVQSLFHLKNKCALCEYFLSHIFFFFMLAHNICFFLTQVELEQVQDLINFSGNRSNINAIILKVNLRANESYVSDEKSSL